MNWVQMVAIFWASLNGVKSNGPRWLLAIVLLGLGVIAVILASYQRFLWPDWLTMGRHQADQFLGRASGPFGIPNSLGAFMLFVIPLLLALTWQRGASAIQRILCGYLALLFLFGLGLSISRGAMLALVASMTIWPLFFRDQTWAARAMLSVSALSGALLLGILAYNTVPRVQQRFDALASDRVNLLSRERRWRAPTVRRWCPSPESLACHHRGLYNRRPSREAQVRVLPGAPAYARLRSRASFDGVMG